MNPHRRKMGHTESVMTAMHAHAAGTTQGLQLLVLEGRMTLPALRSAAQGVYRKYAALRCCIEAGEQSFDLVERAELGDVEVQRVELHRPSEWESVVDRELHDALDITKALWRLLLLSGPADGQHRIVFVYHHAILDATGVHAILSDTLAFADAALAGREVAVNPGSMPPAVDDFLTERSAADFPSPRCPPIPHARPAPLSERRTRFVTDCLDATSYRLLLLRCDRAKIEPNALCSAALSLAARATGIAESPVSFKAAVSLRSCVAARTGSDPQLGCYLAVADTPLDVDGKSIEELARDYQRGLMTAIVRNCFRRVSFRTTDLVTHVQRLVDDPRAHGFGITNAGDVDIPIAHEHFEVRDYLPLATRVAGHHAFALHIAAFAGELKLIYVYTEPLLLARSVERLRASFRELLGSAGAVDSS